MRLQRATWGVIFATLLGAVAIVMFVTERFAVSASARPLLLAGLATLLTATIAAPLQIRHGTTTIASHLDECVLAVAMLVLPPQDVLFMSAVAVSLVQIALRRPVVKAAFNIALHVLATGAALAVQCVLVAPSQQLSGSKVLATALGLVVMFALSQVVGSLLVLSLRGGNMVTILREGQKIRLLLLGASGTIGLVAGVAVAAQPLTLPLAALAFVVCRLILAGHFQARDDRERVLGLFDSALELHRILGERTLRHTLAQHAARLLRAERADVMDTPPPDGALQAELHVQGATRWLSVAGAGPLRAADRALLDALAAVGSGALENSALYGEVERRKEQILAVTESLTEGVCAFDTDGALVFMNSAAEALLGGDRATFNAALRSGARGYGFLRAPVAAALETGTPVTRERGQFFRRGGARFPVEYSCTLINDAAPTDEGAGTPGPGPAEEDGSGAAGVVLAFHDISERVASEDRLQFQAFHDALTGLPNRRAFLDHLQEVLATPAEAGADVRHAVLFIDLDRFKTQNDSLGHKSGDELLTTVAQRLGELVGPRSMLARFGGDEFTMLLEDVAGPGAACAVAARCLERLADPVDLRAGRTVFVGASIGVALGAPGASPDDLVHDADVAMYEVKRKGAGGFGLFDAAAMGNRSVERIDLETEMRRAVQNGEFEAYFQPYFDAVTLLPTGAEALVRWKHPRHGLLAPGRFIGLAEDTGLVTALDRVVLAQACREARRWSEQHPGLPFTISANLSTRQFQANDLVATIAQTLKETGLAPERLCLEITETLVCADLDLAVSALCALKTLGVRIAIDDFGTGYSSLSYLKRFPVDVLKLDRSFVTDLGHGGVDTAIANAVIGLARDIGITVIAEGVETEEQLETLQGLGCQVIQGYLLGRPMEAADLGLLLERAGAQLAREPAGKTVA